MPYKTFHFRASDRQSLLDGLLQTAQEEGVDPSSLVTQDEDGEYQIDTSIGLFLDAGEWWETEPTDSTAGTEGSEALANIRTGDPELQSLLETISVGQTRNGVERVDPATPIRSFV